MKITSSLVLLIFVAAIICTITVGCESLLDKQLTPVPQPASGTNTASQLAPLVSELQAIQAVNDEANMTSSREPIDLLLGGLTTLAAAFSGWWVRHKTPTTTNNTVNVTPPKSG